MSDWNVGDLAAAVGVKRADWPDCWFAKDLRANGKIYRVASVNCIRGVVGLRFAEFPSPASHRHWHHASFRKVRPDEREACETEFVTLLKRSRQLADVSTAQGVGDCAARTGSRASHGTSLPPSGLRSVSQGEDQ